MRLGRLSSHAPCPCDSGQTYVDCCGPWHLGLLQGLHAPTPETLMRSRYSAYVLGLIDYLLATWHPGTAPGELELPLVKWLGLEVRHAQASADAGVVEWWSLSLVAAKTAVPSVCTKPVASCASRGVGTMSTASSRRRLKQRRARLAQPQVSPGNLYCLTRPATTCGRQRR